MSVMRAPESPGVWAGQDRVFTVADMADVPDDEFRYELDDGMLLVDNELFENTLPLPVDVRGVVRFSALSTDGERLVILGNQVVLMPVGEARYTEQFPGSL